MGEYATYNGDEVKIGTCESMYYLRADQAHLVTALPGNVDPVREAESIRFRFPFPDEDALEPGQFENHDRGYRLYGMEVPAELADDHYSVQFSARNGYLCSLPCPESGKVPNGLTVHKNGYGGAVSLIQQRKVGDDLVAICRCNGCGMAWRAATLADAQPILDSLERAAAEQDRTAELHDAPGNAEIAKSIREIAHRVRAGYVSEVESCA